MSPYNPNLDSALLIKVTAFQFWGQTCLHVTSDVPFLRERQLGPELSLASKLSILTSLKLSPPRRRLGGVLKAPGPSRGQRM